MIELNRPEIITIVMMGGLVIGVCAGFHIAIVIGALALIGGLLWQEGIGPVVSILQVRVHDILTNYILLAVPLFVFMGNMLERSGISEKLYDTLYLWLGGIRGGLAITTILIGTIMAACVGVISASVAMLSLIALPAMVNRHYSKSLAGGASCAGGTLGILIPPSIMLVLYGPMAQISVGKLFFGAFFPGLVLSGLYCGYVAIRCILQPEMAPPVPKEDRAVPFIRKTSMLITSLIPVALLILGVLGVIFMGIATPTEAAGAGAFIAALLTFVYRKLNWQVLKETALGTLKLSGMIFLIAVMASAFTGVFLRSGCGDVMKDIILAAPAGRWGAFAVIMFICFILGFFIDWLGIVLIMVPIITPIAAALEFNPVWFALMVCVNLQMSFMTPPMAPAIFICRGVAAPGLGVTMADIIRGVVPFVLLIVVGLVLMAVFPEIVLWLPGQMIK